MSAKKPIGQFIGVGVGPGEPGLLPVAAWRALQQCDVIYAPRAESMDFSVALGCLEGLDLPKEKFREIEFKMNPDRAMLSEHYQKIAEQIRSDLRSGCGVAYLTIGDAFTYSTYAYTLAALLKIEPDLQHRTFPGVTSYCAVAAATDWPLGEGKERVLILPCPDEMKELREAIGDNDIVVLMKIGKRLPQVLALLDELNIASQCALGRRVGLPDQFICNDVSQMKTENALGYLSTMLIRKSPRIQRIKTTE